MRSKGGAADVQGYTLVSPWYETANDQFEIRPATGIIVLDIPATVSADMVAHPGLQLLASVNGVTLPIDGSYDTATGVFRVELLRLPASFSFALAFNPNIQKLAFGSSAGSAQALSESAILIGDRDIAAAEK